MYIIITTQKTAKIEQKMKAYCISCEIETEIKLRKVIEDVEKKEKQHLGNCYKCKEPMCIIEAT